LEPEVRFLNLTSPEIRTILTDGLGVSRQQALEFWLKRLQGIYGTEPSLNNQLHYVAATLAKFSQSSFDLASGPSPLQGFAKLAEMVAFPAPILINGQPLSAKELEDAGRRFLYLSGFEEQYVFRYFNKATVGRIGSMLFLKAVTDVKHDLLMEMSDNFMAWQHRLAFVRHQLIKRADQTLGTKLVIATPKI
jgi:hypothetical protein